MNLNTLADYRLGGHTWASLVLLRVFSDAGEGLDPKERRKHRLHIPIGFVLVYDPAYGDEAYLKLPGGRAEPEDKTPLDTGVREGYEETGIALLHKQMHYAGNFWKQYDQRRRDKTHHWKCYFYADLYEHQARTMNVHHPGNDGELPRIVLAAEAWELIRSGRIFRDHIKEMEELGLFLFPQIAA